METPIYNFLRQYADNNPAVFHMPGHRMGSGIPENYRGNLLGLDITEIPGSDNLHWPSGIIKDAQKLAASAFGSAHTYFLVNGSTCGILALICASCREGDTLIVGRDCHRSVINAMLLAGVEPVYIMPEFNDKFGITTVIKPSQIEKALDENPHATGVFITRPGYYGTCSDIYKICEIVHKKGKLLLVDEAHGSHLRFNSRLPECAMDAGADACVQSAHKTLPTVTQGAYLHIKGERLDLDRLQFYLDIYQTTSPSYIIMAYLDIARAIMEKEGKKLLDRLLESVDNTKAVISGIGELKTLDGIKNGRLDPSRLVINTNSIGVSGFDMLGFLRDNCNLQVEMADLYNIVCLTTVSNTEEDFERLTNGLRKACSIFHGSQASVPRAIIKPPDVPERVMGLKEAVTGGVSMVRFSDCAGRISRCAITPYPPGIPVICPGEVFTPEIIQYLDKIIKSGGFVGGLTESFDVPVVG